MKKWLTLKYNWVEKYEFQTWGKIQLYLDLFPAKMNAKENGIKYELFRKKVFNIRILYPAELLLLVIGNKRYPHVYKSSGNISPTYISDY